MAGKDVKPANTANNTKAKPSDVKARQQSCMISDVDKDLVPYPSFSFPPTTNHYLKTSESAWQTCSTSYRYIEKG